MAIDSNFPALGDFTFALQSALSAYSDEMYTNAKKLSGTAIVGSNAQIDPTTETYIGQTRFFKPYSAQVVNVANIPADGGAGTDGIKQTYTSDYLTYIKTVRTHGAQEINVQRVISQKDGLAKIARDFGEVRAQDEHESILSVIRGVAGTEIAYGGLQNGADATDLKGGLQDFGDYIDYNTGNAPTAQTTDATSDARRGYYVDINAGRYSEAGAGGVATDGAFGADVAAAADARGLIMDQDAATVGYGAVLGENLFKAVSLGFADYEPDYLYMVTSPKVMTQLRLANLVDQTRIQEGNLMFDTIFNGKFRLLMSRTNQGDFSGSTGVNDFSTQTTYLIKPGAIEMAMLDVPMQVEMFRNANTFSGGGSTDIWYRWGYVAHPMGYDWTGSQTGFAEKASEANRDVPGGGNELGTGDSYEASGAWARKFDALNLGILPILHA